MQDLAFTAAEIARALGVSPQRARQRLGNIPSASRTVAGQEAKAWTIQQLSSDLIALLEKSAQKRKVASVIALLRNASPQWEPEIPLAQIADKQIAEASLRKEALAPILATRKNKPVATLIEEALTNFARNGGEAPSESTLRRLIVTAIKRDHGNEAWTRLQLYLDDRLTHRDEPAAAPIESCRLPALSMVLESIEDPGDPSLDRLSILRQAMNEMQRLQASGLSQPMARNAVVDTIASSGVHLSPSREGLRKLIRRNWEKWIAGGQSDEALHDLPRSGRPPLVQPPPESIRAMRTLHLQTRSVTTAARIYARKPECPEDLRAEILKERSSKHKLPPSLRKAITVSQIVRDQYNSPKAARMNNFTQPRNGNYIARDGLLQDLLPGQLFERDDMSMNCLFWLPWKWGGDPCSEKFGVRLCRGQLLVSMDVGSRRFLSFSLLARPRDSYRADDIWAWIGHDYSEIGMPQIGERLERGTWKSKKIYGSHFNSWDGKSDIEESKRIGGLTSLGVKQITAHTPSSKYIEGRFNFLQTVMGDIPGQIGRDRSEMERETKLWMACNAGSRDPREHFLDYSTVLDRIEAAMLFCNSEPTEGKIVRGIPDKIWEESGAASRLRKLPLEKSYLFARDRAEITVRKGHINIRRKSADGFSISWWFHDHKLHDLEGQRVQVYFDLFAPGAGASIVDYKDRQLCHAELIQGCPQFSLDSASRDESSMDRRRRFQDAVVSECRIIDPRKEHRKSLSRISDGRGEEYIVTGADTHARRFPGNANDRNHSPGMDLIREAQSQHRKSRISTPEPDFVEIERLERDARDRGEFLLH